MQRRENVYASVRKYVKTSLVTGESLVVDLNDATELDVSGSAEWLELRFLERSAPARFPHMTGDAERGEIVELGVELHIYVRKAARVDNGANTWRHWELADLIDQYLHQGTRINVYQLQSGGTPATVVGAVKVIRTEPLRNLGQATKHGHTVLWHMYEAILKWDRPLA